jgi:hypothetical protein
MKNYEVKAVLTTTDENGKGIKKTEQYLVTGATSCASAEYAVMTEKAALQHVELSIVSSKESKLETQLGPELDLSEFYYKVTNEEVVSEPDAEKLKFKRNSILVKAIDISWAVTNGFEQFKETVSVTRSRIVEIIAANE